MNIHDILNSHFPPLQTSKEAKHNVAKIEKSLLQSAQELTAQIKATNAKLESSIRATDLALGINQ
jgi:hypothetical protein